MALLYLVDTPRVGVHGFFLEVADEPVGDFRRDQVAEEHGVEEDALRSQDERLHEQTWFAHLHEGEQVHALIVGLFEEGLDPAVVPLEASERVQVSEHTGYHAGDAGDGFEEDEAD